MRAKGYADPEYATTLAEFGTPIRLPGSGGSLLVRQIPGWADLHDAMGPYPLFSCTNWNELSADLEGLSDKVVCVALVSDPFGAWTLDGLKDCFPDLTIPFKDHLVVDLSAGEAYHPHHRRAIARAERYVEVANVLSPGEMLAEWIELYDNLVARHSIRGLAAFSPSAFAAQLELSGLLAFRARRGDQTVGAVLWVVRGDVAYCHLAAYSDLGYSLEASYALFASALKHLAGAGVRWASLGAGAGIGGSDVSDGLTQFKKGWATHTRTAYLCGRVLQHDTYKQILCGLSDPHKSYFPAYRAGEFK